MRRNELLIASVIAWIGLAFIGVPIAFIFIGATIVAILSGSLGTEFFPLSAFSTLYSVVLLAVPFFLLAAEMMSHGGLAQHILDFISSVTRRVRGGLGYAAIFGNVILGAISGSSISDVTATCRIMLPEMKARGWDMRYATALVSCCGGFAMLIPPSLQHIIFGLVSGVSVAKLFFSTIFPGFILASLFAIINFWKAPKVAPKDDVITTFSNWKEETKDVAWLFIRAIPAFSMPVIILGGIYSGLFTPSESAAVAAVSAMLIGAVIYRRLKRKNFLEGLLATCNTTGVILIIVVFVSTFTRILNLAGVSNMLASALLGISENKYVILFFINIMVIILGMLMDNGTGTVLAVPLLMPVIKAIGVEPVHFGAFFAVNWMAGSVTPPVALCLFVGARLSGIPFNQIVKPAIPFILAIIGVTFLTTYVPQLSLFLPNLMD